MLDVEQDKTNRETVVSGFVFVSAEYRAELYWRLESKRMKALSKENTPLNEVTPTDENNNVNKDVKDNNNNEVN